MQYQSVQEQDIEHFRQGKLQAIVIGKGIGNSMADLHLSYMGWQFGHSALAGQFKTALEMAEWLRSELGEPPSSSTEPKTPSPDQ